MTTKGIIVLSFLSIGSVLSSVLFNNNTHCPLEAMVQSTNSTKNLKTLNITKSLNYTKNEYNGTYCPCTYKTCLPLCCPNGQKISKNKCITIQQENNTISQIDFPSIYDYTNFTLLEWSIKLNIKTAYIDHLHEQLHFFVRDPCYGGVRYRLNPMRNSNDSFKLLNNGSIYQTVHEKLIDFTSYCIGYINGPEYNIVLCLEPDNDDDDLLSGNINVTLPYGALISVPFLLITFFVYSIIPELNNIHGRTLRGYIGPLTIAYISLATIQIVPPRNINDNACIAIGIIIKFNYLWIIKIFNLQRKINIVIYIFA